jgi:hypothetical protein
VFPGAALADLPISSAADKATADDLALLRAASIASR